MDYTLIYPTHLFPLQITLMPEGNFGLSKHKVYCSELLYQGLFSKDDQAHFRETDQLFARESLQYIDSFCKAVSFLLKNRMNLSMLCETLFLATNGLLEPSAGFLIPCVREVNDQGDLFEQIAEVYALCLRMNRDNALHNDITYLNSRGEKLSMMPLSFV